MLLVALFILVNVALLLVPLVDMLLLVAVLLLVRLVVAVLLFIFVVAQLIVLVWSSPCCSFLVLAVLRVLSVAVLLLVALLLHVTVLFIRLVVALRKNALTPPPLTRFRWHEPVLTHVGSRRRTVLGARRPRQVQDRKMFGCE